MSGKERGGRIRRGRQHLPRNFLTPTLSPPAFSAPKPRRSTSPAQYQQSPIYSCPQARQKYVAPPPFPNLSIPDTVITSILATSPDEVFDFPATATTIQRPGPVMYATDESKDKAEAKNNASAEEKARNYPTKCQTKKYKRRAGRSGRKPGREAAGNLRATCGHCKQPKNHMITPSMPPKEGMDEENGGHGVRIITDSDIESLICACDADKELRRVHRRNVYVEGEQPGCPKNIVGDVID